MATLKQLKEQIKTTESIKIITQTLGDIATSRIKETRVSVEQNINYFNEISQVYTIVRAIASRSKKIQTVTKNGKTIAIVLTSNYGFYGGLDGELINYYVAESSKYTCDRIVIGNSGQAAIRATTLADKVETMIFAHDFPTPAELSALFQKITSYTKVIVYHSKFVTLLNQEPVAVDISESNSQADEQATASIHYILEPEIAKMSQFFRKQIMVLMLQAIFLDSDIARTAARMISMNQAGDMADKILGNNKKQLLRHKKQKLNRQILETFAGLVGGKQT